MSTPHVVAIDLGTSGPKVAVVDPDGHPAGTARAHVDTLHLPGGGVEQDPEQVWGAVVEATTAALAASGVARDDVVAVVCASQYSSIVPVDREGRPTANMIIWQDHRGASSSLKRLPGTPRVIDSPVNLARWLRLHGLPPISGGISLTHMRYLKYGRPDVYDRTAYLLEPMDFLTMRLTGRATANQATAFMSLMVDNRTLKAGDYADELVKMSLIDRDKLPELVPMNEIVGTVRPDVANELGLSPDTKVVTGLNDTQAGGVGCGAFTGSHAGVSVGSTCVMITHVDNKHTDVRHAILSMPSPVPDRYFVMAENGMAGAALDRFLANVVYPDDPFVETIADAPDDRFDRLERAAATAPAGSHNLMFLPWVGGSLAPAANDYVRGGFLNITPTTTRSDMARAVLEGVALNLRWLRGPVEKFAKRSFDHFTFYGGAAQSALWCQIMADVMGTPVHQLEHGDYTVSIGAGLLAFERLGMIGFDDITSAVRSSRVFDPDPAHIDTYDLLADQLVKAFNRTKPVFRALNRG
ncbi:MAG: carbohydrate kinase [Actinomycetia bacterium]|nr:carbohydrate kinase [Actinomycetes bacterium]